jgi:hypothetical protein
MFPYPPSCLIKQPGMEIFKHVNFWNIEIVMDLDVYCRLPLYSGWIDSSSSCVREYMENLGPVGLTNHIEAPDCI